MIAANQVRTFSAEDSQVAFPLGGIGTGNVALGARGDLRDWEIANHAAKGTSLPTTFFAIHVRAGDGPAITRVLEGPVQPPYNLSHGYHPATAAGLPRLAGTTFRGEYPLAWIDFEDPALPIKIQLEAFTPLVPLDPAGSGLPCAVLTYTISNTAAEPVSFTIAGSLINPIGGIAFDLFGNLAAGGTGQNVNELRDEGDLRGLHLRSEKYAADDLRYGDLTLATSHPNITVKRVWLRGAWYDFLQEFWDDFSADGLLDDLGYTDPSPEGKTDSCTLGLVDSLAPGEQKAYRFLLTWYFPNRTNSWNNKPEAPIVRNHYAAQFGSAWEVARYLVTELPRLEQATRRFHAALFNGTLPACVIEALAANIVPLRSQTCFWLEDGRFFGFEGLFEQSGCCTGSCTHVWGYAQTLAYLFPSLEREMRRIEFMLETDSSGYMAFRTYKAFDAEFVFPWAEQNPGAAVDGQMSAILRAYREWLLSGDREWLTSLWPSIKRAIAFAGTHWDADRDQVLDGKQHNTYDIEFYGPNPLCQFYYLAALRAVEMLANVMDEPELATRARLAFDTGSQRTDELLWNGAYFVQRLDDVNAHKYQHGDGCLSDQLLGQLYARMLGLGDLVPQAHVRSAIGAVFTHNFKRNFRDHVNCQRTYILNDEAGLVLCSWPNGGRPQFPFVYSDEVWPGIEYQVAAQLIYEGWIDEGVQIVQAVRDRHDGVRRNPWNEVECGYHYARSMASWALLLALSGFRCDVAAGALTFAPASAAEEFCAFFSAGTAWGSFAQHTTGDSLTVRLSLEAGSFRLRQLSLAQSNPAHPASATLNASPLSVNLEHVAGLAVVKFDQGLALGAGDKLTISFTGSQGATHELQTS